MRAEVVLYGGFTNELNAPVYDYEDHGSMHVCTLACRENTLRENVGMPPSVSDTTQVVSPVPERSRRPPRRPVAEWRGNAVNTGQLHWTLRWTHELYAERGVVKVTHPQLKRMHCTTDGFQYVHDIAMAGESKYCSA